MRLYIIYVMKIDLPAKQAIIKVKPFILVVFSTWSDYELK